MDIPKNFAVVGTNSFSQINKIVKQSAGIKFNLFLIQLQFCINQ